MRLAKNVLACALKRENEFFLSKYKKEKVKGGEEKKPNSVTQEERTRCHLNEKPVSSFQDVTVKNEQKNMYTVVKKKAKPTKSPENPHPSTPPNPTNQQNPTKQPP